MIRFFARKELIKANCPKEDEVLCTYHLKTLMLWACEEKSPDWWIASSTIKICSSLLQTLAKWLKEKTCRNYFIPRANLFNKDPKIYAEITAHLIGFCDTSILCIWFVKHYMQPICLSLCNWKLVCRHSRCVKSLLSRTCAAMKARRYDHVDSYFSRRFNYAIGYAHAGAKEGCGYELPDATKHQFRACSISSNVQIFQPSTEVESCFEFYESMLLILHADYMRRFEKMEHDSEWFIEVVRQVSIRPKFLRWVHNNSPIPWKANPNRSRLYFLKAQDLMDNLTRSTNDMGFQLVSKLSENLLTKALEIDDSETDTIASAAMTYLAALHFAKSKYRIAIDLCLIVIRNQSPEEEHLIASCLYFIDDIVRIIGLYLLSRHIRDTLHCSRRQFYLDLRLTPEMFAHYLITLSNERSRPFVVSYDLQTKTVFPMDEILMTISNRKSLGTSWTLQSVSHVYRRLDQIHKLVAAIRLSFPNKHELTCVLREFALENMASFYYAIGKDFGIHCNVVDCYRAAHLYQRRNYPEVLNLCERILDKPELQSDLKQLAFTNVMVVPPLDSFFDTDVQCLLGLHTLACCLSPLNGVSEETEDIRWSEFQHVFTKKISSGKNNLSVVLMKDYSVKCNYFLGTHFLARYLKVRCFVDFHLSSPEVVLEFGKLRCHLPFEHIIRCYLQQQLRNRNKHISL